jgi:hypothetical protein
MSNVLSFVPAQIYAVGMSLNFAKDHAAFGPAEGEMSCQRGLRALVAPDQILSILRAALLYFM